MASPIPITITKTNTCWLFISGAVEPRHIYDVILAVDCLRRAGVPDSHMYFFMDHPLLNKYLAPFEISENVHSLTDFASVVPTIKGYETAFVTVGGHGAPTGIPFRMNSPDHVTPAELLDQVRVIPGIKVGTIFLGQCFAGLFNFTAAGTKEPRLSVIGATNLNPSLSSKITLTTPLKAKTGTEIATWSANIFLMYLALWLNEPIDLDGDGKHSIVDAYRFAGVYANERLRSIKATLHFDVETLKSQQMSALLSVPEEPTDDFVVSIHAFQRQLNDAVDTLYLHQEPWMLNAFQAQATCVDLFDTETTTSNA